MNGEFTLIFDLDSSAFQDGDGAQEIARIMKDIAEKVDFMDHGPVHDINGNFVGAWSTHWEEEK